MAATSSTSGRGATRDPPSGSAGAGRRGNNSYTSLNLQSYKGGRPDGKGFTGGKLECGYGVGL